MPSINIQLPVEMGKVCYLKTDQDQLPRILTDAGQNMAGANVYTLACGTESSDHFWGEISRERNIIFTEKDIEDAEDDGEPVKK